MNFSSKLVEENEKLICRVAELERAIKNLQNEVDVLKISNETSKSIINLQTGQINFMLDAIQTKDLYKYKESCF